MIISRIDESKTTKFYNEVIVEFDKHEEIFGKLDDFKDLIKSSEEREDGLAVPTKLSNTSIYFQKELFENLFCLGFAQANFDSKEGKLIIDNKLYTELYLSPVFYPRERELSDINKDYGKIFVFVKGKGGIYYSSKIIPYFIRTIKNRFINKNVFAEREFDFYDFFKTIEGLIFINKDDFSGDQVDRVEKNLIFQMAKKYGLVPIEEEILTKKFTLPKEGDEFKIEVESKTSLAIDYYLKGLRATSAFYQFLNFYQVIERYSLVYSLKYLIGKIEEKEPYEAHQIVKNMHKEEYLISYAVSYLLKGRESELKTKLGILNEEDSVQDLIIKLKEISSHEIKNFYNWKENNCTENLGKLIYKIRNEIVHTKRKKDILGDLISKYLNVFQYIIEILKDISEKGIEEDLRL